MNTRLLRSLTLDPFLRLVCRPAFQPLLEKVRRLTLMGMNYGGGYALTDSGELDVLRQLALGAQGPLVIFDVGANEGHYAEAALDLLGPRAQVHSFEPSPRAFHVLTERLGTRPGLTRHHFGLGEAETSAVLYANTPGSVVSSLYQGRDPSGVRTSEACRIRTLDAFCREAGIGRIHLLKLDVEGNELSALKGAEELIHAGAIDRIQFEFGEAQVESRNYLRDFFDLLTPRYQIHRLLRRGLWPLGPYDYIHEVFRTTNYLAIRRD